MWRLLVLALLAVADDTADKDGESSRKVLGSSVVTSVSVIMDSGNGSKIYADAVGKPVSKPQVATDVASPIDLLNPDRYEFYTFDDSGDLVKRLMTLEEIHDIIATGDDDGFTLDSFTSNGFIPEKRVNDVVNNVQNVLKEEIKMHKNPEKPQFDTPDVSDSWSMILPAVFGNSGEDIKPERPITHVTPDTIMVEPGINVMATTEHISTTEKVMTLQTKKPISKTTTTTTEKTPLINVEIITNSNSNSTTERTNNLQNESSPIVEIKPPHEFESTKENFKPVLQYKSTKRPFPVKVTTFKPSKRPIVLSSTISRRSTTTRPRTTSTTPQTTSTTPRTTSTTTSTTTPQTTSTTTPRTTSTTQMSTIQVFKDATAQASTILFEKIAPPQISTTTTTITTEVPSTTDLPTTTENISMFSSTTVPTTTDLQEMSSTETSNVITTTETEESRFVPVETTERTPSETSTQPDVTSTFGSFSTFFMVGNNKLIPETTNSDDLSTLSTEYITVKTITPNKTTTESQTTDKSTTQTLEQYLLTSTNIYEINSELSAFQQTTDNAESTTIAEDKTTEQFLIRLTDATEAPTTTTLKTTTDQTFIESIEQLISQAVGTAAPPVEAQKETTMVEEMIMKSNNKTMLEIMSETATAASNLIGFRKEVSTVPTTTFDDTNLSLSESVGALLSQVYRQGSTTLEYETTSMVPESTTTSVPTTTLPPPTTTIPTSTVGSTTASTTTTPVPTTTQGFVPHIINITLISNENRTQPKPAKADLSLEMEYDEIISELKKNSTLAAMIPNPELLKLDATSQLQNQNTAEIGNFTESVTTPAEEESTVYSTPSTTTIISSSTMTTAEPKPSIVITINESNKTSEEEPVWTLVSTLSPHSEIQHDPPQPLPQISSFVDPPNPVDLVPKPLQGFGLEDSTARLDTDIYQFVQLCNELAFGFWKSVNTGISSARSVVVSPFAATSLLAMVFLGARGATSGEMNEILRLDDMVTFNPHLIFKNVSESIETNPDSGVAVSAIIRELYSDRSKGKLLGFYKERVRQFYDGHVEEVSFKEIGDVIRRRTNLLVKKHTDGKIGEYLKDGSLIPKPPLAGVSVNIFQTDCSQGSSEGRDGELHFVVLPSIRQRRLIPIPATVYRSGFLAGYEPSLDATAAALGTKDQIISTIFIIPGQQGTAAPGDGLARLEKRLVESSFKKGAWSRLLRSLIPRPGLELQIPRFQHRSLLNATQSLKRMGLHDLFDSKKADLKGLNGAAHELHLSDVSQINEFATCGERRIGEAHHREVYPATADRKSRLLEGEWEEPRDYQRAFHDPLHDPTYLSLPLSLRPRQARVPEAPRLRFDRPFLYFVRHNPSGLILHMGRFHPRLLP